MTTTDRRNRHRRRGRRPAPSAARTKTPTPRRRFAALLLLAMLAAASSGNLFDPDDHDVLPHPDGNHRPPRKKQTRIIGGRPLSPSEYRERYPYFASLQWGTHRCGGTLVAPDLLVTAAHCARVRWDEEEGVRREWFTEEELEDGYVPAIYTVEFGKLDLGSDDDAYPAANDFDVNGVKKNGTSTRHRETLVVETTVVHPDFDATESPPHPDIAIVKLYGSSKLNTFAKLNFDPDLPPPEVNLTTMGYGTFTKTPQSEHDNALQYANVTYVPNGRCRPMGGGGLWGLVEDGMMCGFGDGERDSCSGDSGGPLFWEKRAESVAGEPERGVRDGSDNGTDANETRRGEVYQVGIVSWGVGCAHPNYPGVHTRISYYYDWVRSQVCRLSKSPPRSFGCDALTGPPSSTLPNGTAAAAAAADMAYSTTPLVVSLELYSSDLHRYGLLVESLPLDGGDCDDRRGETATLLDLPPGSLAGTTGAREYSLRVRLGQQYRIILLNTAGVERSGGLFTVTWGDELLVWESARQGGLRVYSIERRFRIGDADGDGVSQDAATSPSEMGTPSAAPSGTPSELRLVLNDRLPASPSGAHNPAPSALAFSQAQFRPSASAFAIVGGTHTIDPGYVEAEFGHGDGILPRGIAVTQGFALIAEGVEILAAEGTEAVTLYEKSYLLGDGGRLVGGSSSPGQAGVTATAVSRTSRLRNGDGPANNSEGETKVTAAPGPPGHGLMVINSKADAMPGFRSEGGPSLDAREAGGAGLYVAQGSTVAVRGGSFAGGSNSFDESMAGPSVVVDGKDSIVHVHEGSFRGSWKAVRGGTIVVHACSFYIGLDEGIVRASLADGGLLEVAYVTDGSGNVTSTPAEECDRTSSSPHGGGETPPKDDFVVHFPSPSRDPSGRGGSSNSGSSRPDLERPAHDDDVTSGDGTSQQLSLRLDVEDYVVPDEAASSAGADDGAAEEGDGTSGAGGGRRRSAAAAVGSAIGAACFLFS